MDMVEEPEHGLDRPRVNLLLGPFGLSGVGITLMAPTLFWLGAFICYCGAVITVVRYKSHLLNLVRLRGGGMHLVEAILLPFLIVAEIAIPTYLIWQKEAVPIVVAKSEDGPLIPTSDFAAAWMHYLHPGMPITPANQSPLCNPQSSVSNIFMNGGKNGITINGGGCNNFNNIHINNTQNPINLNNTSANNFQNTDINNQVSGASLRDRQPERHPAPRQPPRP